MKCWTKVTLVCILLAYIFIGGAVFHVMERNHEHAVKTEAKIDFHQFLANKTCLGEEELLLLMTKMYEAYHNGVLESLNSTNYTTNWDLHSSLFFAVTVVTSIGYGNIYPTTNGSRIFCVFYALLGIPLCLIVLAQIGSTICYGIRKLLDWIRASFKKDSSISKNRAALTADMINIVIGILILFIIPSITFMHFEGWSFGVGLYYCLISLSTVGFGDYVAGVNSNSDYRGLYRVMLGVWLLIGLAWFASIVTLIQQRITDFLKKRRDKREERLKEKLKPVILYLTANAELTANTKL